MKYRDFINRPVKLSPNLVEIAFDGQGRLAEALVGYYSSAGIAKRQIDAYLEGKLGRKVKNAQAGSEG